MVMCKDGVNSVNSAAIQRSFDVSPGSSLNITMRARVDSATGSIDDSYTTVIAGSQ
jgi:hypothetical protein